MNNWVEKYMFMMRFNYLEAGEHNCQNMRIKVILKLYYNT